MNKTRRRAIQKHRAKDAKFDVRRKSSGEQGDSRAKATASASAPARQRTASTRRQTGEATE